MIKKIVYKNGKRYVVNAPGWGDGIGPGSSIGTLWMSEGSASWYSVYIVGAGGGATLTVSQSAFPNYSDNTTGYQLLAGDDGRSYFVYLSGTSPVTFNVSQSAYTGSANPKPNLLLQSTTDSNFYKVYIHNSGGVKTAVVDPLYVSASWVYQSGIY